MPAEKKAAQTGQSGPNGGQSGAIDKPHYTIFSPSDIDLIADPPDDNGWRFLPGYSGLFFGADGRLYDGEYDALAGQIASVQTALEVAKRKAAELPAARPLVDHYQAFGWALVPLEGKQPIGKDWPNNAITAGQTFPEGRGVGLLHRDSGTAVIDIDNQFASMPFQAAKGIDLDEFLANVPFAIIGNPARQAKAIFRIPDGITLPLRQLKWPHETDKLPNGKPKLVTIFELRGNGTNCQDVLPPTIHPDTGKPYAWRGGRVPQTVDDIPILPGWLLDLWQNWEKYLPKMESVCPWRAASPPAAARPAENGASSDALDVGAVSREFNARYTVGDVLSRNGYQQKGGKWLAPSSSSKIPGVVILDGVKAYSHHGSDVLNDGKPHDAYDLAVILEYDGDRKAAWRKLARELKIKITTATPTATATAGASAAGTAVPAVALAEYLPELPLESVLKALNNGEYGDGQLFGELYQGRVVYDHSEKTWYWWAGHYWRPDQTGQTKRLVSGQLAGQYLRASGQLAPQIEAAAAAVKEAEGETAVKEATKLLDSLTAAKRAAGPRADKLRSKKGRDNCLDFAETEAAVRGSEWDSGLTGWLPVANGLVNMETGELLPGDPARFVRTVIPHEWADKDTPCPRFERFMGEIFNDDLPLIAFVRRWLGYAASGRATEHRLPIFWGEGRNGKDTLFEVMGHVLGPLAGAVSKDVMLDPGGRRTAGTASPHIMTLRGKRLVWASEPKGGARLDAAQVKLLTGGGQITARGLYQGETSFTPTHAMGLLTNHKPGAPADDFALWQRLLLVPFSQTFVERPTGTQRKADPTLGAALRQEAAGILAWLVTGYQDYLANGLQPPDVVTAATSAYQEQEDWLGDFLEDCCLVGAGKLAGAQLLYNRYKAWADENGMRPVANKTFAQRLTGRVEDGVTITKERKGAGNVYYGVGLLADPAAE